MCLTSARAHRSNVMINNKETTAIIFVENISNILTNKWLRIPEQLKHFYECLRSLVYYLSYIYWFLFKFLKIIPLIYLVLQSIKWIGENFHSKTTTMQFTFKLHLLFYVIDLMWYFAALIDVVEIEELVCLKFHR